MSAIDTELAELATEFEVLGDWEERYRYVIDLGKDLSPLTDAERNDANKVRGCASQVWLVTEPQADGTLKFRGDSDAHIVSGLIAIVVPRVPRPAPRRDPRLRRARRLRDPGPQGRAVAAAVQRTGVDGGAHP